MDNGHITKIRHPKTSNPFYKILIKCPLLDLETDDADLNCACLLNGSLEASNLRINLRAIHNAIPL